MSAWSPNSFDNDDALDWLDDLCDSGDEYVVGAALAVVADWPDGEFLEAIDCCVAIAAAEMVAAAMGMPPADFPQEAEEWLERTAPEYGKQEAVLARRAIARIKANSELKDIWKESELYEEWLGAIEDLERRLP